MAAGILGVCETHGEDELARVEKSLQGAVVAWARGIAKWAGARAPFEDPIPGPGQLPPFAAVILQAQNIL
ncbi:hypothetical protein AJ79_03083 [Helicocarpus griseus UAMH5409]|uniref:Uncharacterized protein n=1 Tax=Helicocarpus griseus UAMH5409 TaxID=1447875 RepID=A0A2B7XZJ0_9EURO|nr:hypothetical protein AJ79_03083 [Helicocarpus griseus UAMH5409]